MSDVSDLDLLEELGENPTAEKPKQYTAVEARLIAGFEDILRFVAENGRAPQHGEERDIFERLYAVRLDRLQQNKQAQQLLGNMDEDGLLQPATMANTDDTDDAEILADLGVELESDEQTDITKLRHVSPVAHRKAAEEIAGREVCRDFESFEHLFEQIRADLEAGVRRTRDSARQEDIDVNSVFVVKGQLAYVAEKGEEFKPSGKNAMDARLRVVFDNGTESNLLLRSLQRSLYGDDRSRLVTSPDAGPLFSNSAEEGDETGTIYVLRSESKLPEIVPIRDAILKIGVTGGDVKARVAGAHTDPTYLLGGVKVVDEYKLYNVNRAKLERMLHYIFRQARLQVSIKDRFGKPFVPREWFMVPPNAVNQAVDFIRSGEIRHYRYDPPSARFLKDDEEFQA